MHFFLRRTASSRIVQHGKMSYLRAGHSQLATRWLTCRLHHKQSTNMHSSTLPDRTANVASAALAIGASGLITAYMIESNWTKEHASDGHAQQEVQTHFHYSAAPEGRAQSNRAAEAGKLADGGHITADKPILEKTSGIRLEYKCTPRTVERLDPPKHGFFAKEIQTLGVPIRAHASVSDAAMVVAADRLSRMLRNLPEPVISRLQNRGAAFHIIGIDQGTTDLPEHAHMKGVAGGYTKEGEITLDQRARGMGGVRSSCGEENLIDLDTDPRYAGRDILTHEFAHCIMDVGLPPKLQQKIHETYETSVLQHSRWTMPDGKRAYAGSCASEYFAELTMWYFGSHGEFVDRKDKLPSPGPGGLAAYDPDGFSLLSSIFSGTHPALADADPPQELLAPLESPAKSVDLEDEMVTMEFDNRGCACDWALYWIDSGGERFHYGQVVSGSTQLQKTFPGHVWLLESSTATTMGARVDKLQYSASKKTCLAAVSADAGCHHAHGVR
mmetsp:Transcript_36927/g.61200  ORF Transcript_36927/g.61200 Transcript_36927/m.61200 type:complete len:499 (+) Transcript_36927:65-1561(+)